MKISLKKLQKFATLGHDKRPPKKKFILAEDELLQATQDLNDMRNCYESLHATGAELMNRVFELSESSKEMGDCLLEQTALNDDEDSGKILLMLGKVEFEVQKHVDRYRSHIVQTITSPSENILSELRKVEEMKQQSDEKRLEYEEMMRKQKEKGRAKGEAFSLHHIQEEYSEQANVFVSRMKSLKQAKSHSLLTQATRHYFAQLSFAKKWVQSLQAIEPPVKLVAEQQHIDYQFNDDEMEIYEDDYESESDSGRDYDSCEEGSELSFEYEKGGRVQEAIESCNPMELDDTCSTFAPSLKSEAPKVTFRNSGRVSYSFQRDLRAISQSAPLFPDKKIDPTERPTQKRPWLSHKFTSYKLPTPDEAVSLKPKQPNLWHSSPLDQRMSENFQAKHKLSSAPIILDTQSVLKKSNKASNNLFPLSFDPNASKKPKIYAFSGPLIGTAPLSSEPIGYSTLSRPLPIPTVSPPRLSRFKPSPFVSSPEIRELHVLPLPPSRAINLYTQSGPITSRNYEHLSMARVYPLQRPTHVVPRSFSIPTRGSGDFSFVDVSLEGSENISSSHHK